MPQVCGPVWNDQSWYAYDFPVGRCQLIPPGTSSLSPLYNKLGHRYIGPVEVDGKTYDNHLNGFAQFGFSAAVDGVIFLYIVFKYIYETYVSFRDIRNNVITLRVIILELINQTIKYTPV